MCTVTVVTATAARNSPRPPPSGLRLRLACNRDEQRERSAARPPVLRTYGGIRAVMPVDPISNGTWIAVNEYGLLMTLLNANPECFADAVVAPRMRRPPMSLSRGTVIPQLIACRSVTQVLAAAADLPLAQLAPFRLIVLDGAQIVELVSDTGGHRQVGWLAAEPRMFASSGLGDALVDPPRRRLFDESVAKADDRLAAQFAFHRHSWPDRPHLSVCMRRPDARTVSYTQVDLHADHARMVYHPGPPDEDAVRHAQVLPLARTGA